MAENAFTREGAEAMYENANEPKEFHLIEGANHIDLYDVEEYVTPLSYPGFTPELRE